ncbi:IS3 family transposase [Virgibacillus dokdonensis]
MSKRFYKKHQTISGPSIKKIITDLFKKFHERYGYKRITEELKKLGHSINHKKSVSHHARIGIKMCEIYAKNP